MDRRANGASWWQAHRPSKRRLIQLYSALLYNAQIRGFAQSTIYTGASKAVCVPGLNCYSCPGAVGACPLGAIQNALAQAHERTSFYVIGVMLLYGVLLGRTVCGWLCPMGMLQELLHRIPTPKLPKSRATRVLSYLKYALLAVFAVAIPLWYGAARGLAVPGFCKYICPAGTLEGAVGLLATPVGRQSFFGMLGALFTRKFIIMLLIGLACVFCYRAFCRFLCPLGALYGMFSRLAVIGVKVEADRCNGCGACVRRCKMDVRRVGDHECIHCAHCVAACPRESLALKAGGYTLKGPEGGMTGEAPELMAKRRRRSRAAWACATVALCGVLVCYNFLDPTVRTRAEAKPGTSAEAPAVTGEPAAEAGWESDAPVGFGEGQQLEDFECALLDGGTFRLSDYRGKVVVINLWATYCAPCVEELPHFERLMREHDDAMALAVHNSVTTTDVSAFVREHGWNLPFAIDTEDEAIFKAVNGSMTMPQTIVLNRRGEVVYNQTHSITWEALEALYNRAAE